MKISELDEEMNSIAESLRTKKGSARLGDQACEDCGSPMKAYYNEVDPFKAAVLREAIKAGAIAPGEVDERSIKDVKAADLR